MILALGSASFHVNGTFNRKGLKATNPVTPILQPKQLYPHFHPPWKKTRDASSSLKITLETSVSGPGCIKLLKVTGDFSQLLSALQSVMVFPVLFITFFSDSFSIVREKIPQSTGNCCRKSHVILSISMKPGPGPAVFAQKRSDALYALSCYGYLFLWSDKWSIYTGFVHIIIGTFLTLGFHSLTNVEFVPEKPKTNEENGCRIERGLLQNSVHFNKL